MAKIFKAQKQKLLNRKIENLKYQIESSNLYVEIIENRLSEKIENKLKEFQNDLDRQLYQVELTTLSNADYLSEMTKDEITSIKEKTYWKKRAVNTSFKRKFKTKEEQTLNAEILNNQLTHLDEVEKEEILKLNTKYSLRNLTDQEIKDNKASLKTLKNDLKDKYKAYEAQLIKEKNEKLDEIKQKTTTKIQKINDKLLQKTKQLEALTLKLNQSSDTMTYEMSDDAILKLDHLTMQFGGLKAVDDLSFEVKEGEIFGLIGPNGAGKKTAFNCTKQFYKSNMGKVLYRDRSHNIINVGDYKVHDVIKQGIVRTFQNVELIWELSIMDNLLIASHTLYKSGFFEHLVHTRKFKREETILKEKATKILTDLGIIGYKDFYPIGLPYGTLKLVELARTLMTNPRLIILDEPAAGLNDKETESLAITIKKIQKEYNSTIFLVEHDMGLVMELCDTICAISFGKMLAIGTPKDIQANPVVQEAYLGGE
jgi:branched-chain amino acid transport system ATP-binding protein